MSDKLESLGNILKWGFGLAALSVLVYLYATGVIKAEMVPQAFEWFKDLFTK